MNIQNWTGSWFLTTPRTRWLHGALFDVLTTDAQTHFRQAADTPFVTGPVATKLGPFDDNEHSDAILQGTFNATPLTDVPEVRDIIKGMRYPDPANPTPTIPANITVEQFAAAMKHTRESTSSSPSGRHYGQSIKNRNFTVPVIN